MVFSKISYLTVSETSTSLLSQHCGGYCVFCRWEATCWKCKVKRFWVPDKEYRVARTQIFSGFSILQHFVFKSRNTDAVATFCKSVVVQPFWECNGSFGSLHQSPGLSTLALQQISYGNTQTHVHAHWAGFGPVLQLGSGNQSICLENSLGLEGRSSIQKARDSCVTITCRKSSTK